MKDTSKQYASHTCKADAHNNGNGSYLHNNDDAEHSFDTEGSDFSSIAARLIVNLVNVTSD